MIALRILKDFKPKVAGTTLTHTQPSLSWDHPAPVQSTAVRLLPPFTEEILALTFCELRKGLADASGKTVSSEFP